MRKELRKEIGKFIVDVAKLFIGGAVLSSVLKIEGLPKETVIIAGAFIAISLAVLGFLVMNVEDSNNK